MQIRDLEILLEKLVAADKQPIVVYSALWPLMRLLKVKPENVPKIILDILVNLIGNDRSLLMPTFARGYQAGICNLDTEQSTTGTLSELFRQLPKSKRSLSAFFSFNIIGPEANDFSNLTPKYAWGDNSAYDWMEKQNVHFLMLGTHPTHCSYLHRMEWLAKDKINYRYLKQFKGILIRDGKSIQMEENLFVRSLCPLSSNDFTSIFENLLIDGMQQVSIEGFSIAHMRAKNMRNSFLPLIEKNPHIVLKKHHFENNKMA